MKCSVLQDHECSVGIAYMRDVYQNDMDHSTKVTRWPARFCLSACWRVDCRVSLTDKPTNLQGCCLDVAHDTEPDWIQKKRLEVTWWILSRAVLRGKNRACALGSRLPLPVFFWLVLWRRLPLPCWVGSEDYWFFTPYGSFGTSPETYVNSVVVKIWTDSTWGGWWLDSRQNRDEEERGKMHGWIKMRKSGDRHRDTYHESTSKC